MHRAGGAGRLCNYLTTAGSRRRHGIVTGCCQLLWPRKFARLDGVARSAVTWVGTVT